MFGSQIRLKSLALICRTLAMLLHSGVPVTKVFEIAAGKTYDGRCRRALAHLGEAVRAGDEISSAMRDQGGAFPQLMIDMVAVGEQTGALPEILENLADHYDNNLRLRRTFLQSIAWPMFQLTAAILLIALMLLVFGWIAEINNSAPLDILGLGTGPAAAVRWLVTTFGSLIGLYVAYRLISNSFAGKRFLDPLLMKVPVVGGCMRAFAIARFSWAFHLTQNTGMPIDKSLQASLRATGNGAFMNAAWGVCKSVMAGDDLSTALAVSRLFPQEYLHTVAVAESSGTVPEALHRLSPQFEEQARRSLSLLSATAAWLIWAAVAVFIVYFIFRFFLWYASMINDAARGVF